MTIRRKLILMLTGWLVLILAFLVAFVVGFNRVGNVRLAIRVAEKARLEILLQSRALAEFVAARQNDGQMAEDEIAEQLRDHMSEISASLAQLADGGAGAALGDLAPVQGIQSLREAEDTWLLVRDALESVLGGRSVIRNCEFVRDSSIRLSNTMSETVDLLDRAYVRDAARARRMLWAAALAAIVLTLGAFVLLYARLFRPLRAAVSQLKLMSSGELSLEAQMPYDGRDEFGELSRHFNLLVDRMRVADQTKDRFLASMSHEIRTPLNGVIGFLGNLRETPLNEQQNQYVRIIDSSARALLRVINEILDFSKLTAGKMSLEIVAFDLKKLAQDLVAVTRQTAKGKSLRVRLDLDLEQELVVRGDPTRLRQVLDNLLSNAVKFTEGGEVCLSVMVRPSAEDASGVKLLISVTDTGIGIPLGQQERLFEAFAQAETSTTRKYGGTGLGLCIAANLVKLMGGALRVESQEGVGSRFFFELETTVAPPEEQVQLSEHHTIRLPRRALKKFWALLVDDTPTNLFLMETICQSIGLPYATAVNGQEAVDKVKESRFDIIFMDIQMPIMDGYTAIREIRRLESAATTEIIALTASAMQDDVERALGAGSTGFMAKPFERSHLLLCIAEHLGIEVERELRPSDERHETQEQLEVRRMYDFMREQYQISLGEIKLVLAQSVADWRPQLDDLIVYAKKRNWEAIRPTMHRLKGQLGAIGLGRFADVCHEVTTSIKDEKTDHLLELMTEFVGELRKIFRAAEQDITLEFPSPEPEGQ